MPGRPRGRDRAATFRSRSGSCPSPRTSTPSASTASASWAIPSRPSPRWTRTPRTTRSPRSRSSTRTCRRSARSRRRSRRPSRGSTTTATADNFHKLVSMEFGELEAGLRARRPWSATTSSSTRATRTCRSSSTPRVADFGPDGKLTLWSATQTPHYVHRALAKVLEMPAARIRVIATPNGGGFGGKSDPFNHEIVVAHLSRVTSRPVKICLTREEVFYCHRGRHPTLMRVRTGVDEGRRDHRDALPDGARRRRVRLVRRRVDVLHGRAPDRHVRGARVPVRRRPRLHEQAALRTQARARHARSRGSRSKCSSTRSRCDLGLDPADDAPRAPPARRVPHGELPAHRLDGARARASRRSSRPRAGASGAASCPPGRGLGLACSSYICGAGSRSTGTRCRSRECS